MSEATKEEDYAKRVRSFRRKQVNAFEAMKLVIELLRGGSVIEYERKLKALEEDQNDVMN